MAITPAFTIKFDIDEESASVGKFVLTDTSDYAGEGIALSDVEGYLEITYPDGTGRNIGITASTLPANADIDADVSLTNSSIAIPLTANNNYQNGNYQFTYHINVGGAVQAGFYSTSVNTYNFCDDLPDNPDIDWTADCFCYKLTSTDNTDYGDYTVSRTHTITPPSGTSQSASTTSGKVLEYTFTYTGGYNILVNSALTLTSGIFTVQARVKGITLANIKCDYDLCALYSCLNKELTAILNKAATAGGVDNLSIQSQETLTLVSTYQLLFENSYKCGKYASAQKWYEKLRDLLDCDCECGDCEDDTPKQVNPFCGGSSGSSVTVVVSAGTGISVSSNTVGSTTTYTVSVDQSTLDSIAANTTAIAALTTNKYHLLDNDVSDSGTTAAASGSVEDLKTYTFNVTNNPIADEEYIRVKQTFFINNNNRDTAVGFKINAAQYKFDLDGMSTNQYVEIEFDINRVSSSSAWVTYNVRWGGGENGDGTLLYSKQGTLSVAFGSNVSIVAIGQNVGTPYTDNDVVCKSQKVEFIENA